MKTVISKIIISITAVLIMTYQLTGCAVNPVTGDSDFVLMTEEQEIALGRKNHAQILKQYEVYDDKVLQAYVQKIGDKVAQKSHRSNLIYRFTVLDSPEVNAFALPGGYIYITRGLMAYLNSEAELAAVLGHEAGHVTARHSVRQHSAATATNVLGNILSAATGIQAAGDVFGVLGAAIVRGYGREHELESDRLGAEYLARSGYDPQAMFNVIRVLKNQEEFEKKLAKKENREPRIYHGVFSTHPDNDTRLKEVIDAAKKITIKSKTVNREVFLNKTNSMVFGDGEKQGIVKGNNFYHKYLGFVISLPENWNIKNQPDAIVAHTESNDGLLHITMQDLNKRITPREFMIQRLKMDNLRDGETIQVNGNKGYTAWTTAKTPFGNREMRISVIYFKNSAWIFRGVAKDNAAPAKYDHTIMKSTRSFRALKSSEQGLASALKLKLIKARAGITFKELANSSALANYPEDQLRLLNSHYPAGEPKAGSLIKIVK
ncbi:MAG: M48 family metalloprotease [Gammaproteobacteria bacterium]|nr:M48 family metalloprotease [Gammaproteobacteria bacterium]